MQQTRPWYKTWWGILFILFFFPIALTILIWQSKKSFAVKILSTAALYLFVLVFFTSSGRQANDQSPASSASLTREQRLEKIGKELFKGTTLLSFTNDADYGKMLHIEQYQLEMFTHQSYLQDAYTSFINFGQIAFQDPNIDFIMVTYSTDLTDSYGKVTKKMLINLGMSKTIFSKYDWDKLRYGSTSMYKAFEKDAEINTVMRGVLTKLDIDNLYLGGKKTVNFQ